MLHEVTRAVLSSSTIAKARNDRFLTGVYNRARRIEDSVYFYTSIYVKRRTPIVVYQMGKVGSSSIAQSLRSWQSQPVFQVHIMKRDNMRKAWQPFLRDDLPLPDPRHGERLCRHIIEKHKRGKFITLVREPISTCISGFFQNFRRVTGVDYRDANFTIEELVSIFLNNHIRRPLTWFDAEMKEMLGIDVYEYPFPKEKGHLSLRKGNFDLLILKSEVDDSVKEKAIAEFLGIDNFKLTRANVSAEKNYAATYHHFTQAVTLPESYIEEMCNSKYITHFYSQAEIENVRSRWYRSNRG